MEKGWTEDEIYLLADRGYGLYQQGFYREAAVLFEGLTAIAPENAYCRTALAAACLMLGDQQRAVQELNTVLHQNPANHEARARRTELYCDLKQWKEARRDLEILRRNSQWQHFQRLQWRLRAAGQASE
jgi:tetratricopeptide (TPR) repeat protein